MSDVRPHPAKFSDAVMTKAVEILREYEFEDDSIMLDPFAGVGKGIWVAHEMKLRWRGVELEEEWARQNPLTVMGDSTRLVPIVVKNEWAGKIECVFTSPVYGNRMSDHHEAKDGSKRHTYTHYLGRKLTKGNAGEMFFAKKGEYEELHEKVWRGCKTVLNEGGVMLVNVKDFIRDGDVVNVCDWHIQTLKKVGLKIEAVHAVETPGLRHGENHELRAEEVIIEATKP